MECGKNGSMECGKNGSMECRKNGSMECRKNGSMECRKNGSMECRKNGSMECRKNGSMECRKNGSMECRKNGSMECRKNGSMECGKNGSMECGKNGRLECLCLLVSKIYPMFLYMCVRVCACALCTVDRINVRISQNMTSIMKQKTNTYHMQNVCHTIGRIVFKWENMHPYLIGKYCLPHPVIGTNRGNLALTKT